GRVERGGEEVRPGDGPAEVEQPVVDAGGIGDEHALEHLLGHREITRVCNEEGPRFSARSPGQVVAEDLLFLTVAAHDRGARFVSARWTGIVVELDVVGLRPSDDALLLLRGGRYT